MLSGLGVNDETYLQVQTQSLFLYHGETADDENENCRSKHVLGSV